jgi:hypothetical protein
MPGVTPRTFPTDYVAAALSLGNTLLSAPHTAAEPPLACYVTASCPESGPAAAGATKAKAKANAKKRTAKAKHKTKRKAKRHTRAKHPRERHR